jgi:hypothetical protein
VVGVAEPQRRHLLDLGRGLERAVCPAEPAGDELLAGDADAVETRAAREAAQFAGRERVHVDDVLERVLLGLLRVVPPEPHANPDEPAPGRSDRQRGALGIGGQAVPVARRLARERDDAARAQNAAELAERGVEVRQVMQHGVAEDQVERIVGKRQRLGLGADGRHLEPELGRGCAQRVEHALRDVGGHGLADDAGTQQVQREVASAGADLERAVERPDRLPERLAQFADDMPPPLLLVGDSPLGVVLARCDVVVAGVDVLDRLG